MNRTGVKRASGDDRGSRLFNTRPTLQTRQLQNARANGARHKAAPLQGTLGVAQFTPKSASYLGELPTQNSGEPDLSTDPSTDPLTDPFCVLAKRTANGSAVARS
jgi:hypothetical protein